jgi:meso-butanediol dehydrogenase/(S,S)-butanediol dehydrogenase/diacetyl reductase
MVDDAIIGKSVVITGAGSGLGRATAIGFAAAGAKLTLGDVNAQGLQETRDLIGDASDAVILVPGDLTSVDDCRALIDRAVAAHDGIDALCNVAGLFRLNHLANMTPEIWDAIYAVNVRAPFFLMQAAMPHLIKREGAIVNVASASGFFGHSYLAPYASSKAALVNLTKSLAMEFAKSPVRINAIAPGGMNTPMIHTEWPDGIDGSLVSRFAGLRSLAEPEEFVDLILYLASSRAKNVHGACFNVDGGITAG